MSNRDDVENAISTSIFNLNGILEVLKCSICLEYFKNPKTLTCQHTYCHKCIEPLLNDSEIKCPLCNKKSFCANINYLGRNFIVANLLESIQNHKANCPNCKQKESLVFCEHCSQIFCKQCIANHIDSTVGNLKTKCAKLETDSLRIDLVRADLQADEQHVIKHTIKEMDRLQNEFLSVWQSRKLSLIEQINRFYQAKTKTIDDSKCLVNESIDALGRFKNNLSQLEADKCEIIKKMQTLTDIEAKVAQMDKQIGSHISNLNLKEQSNLSFVCEKLSSFDIYKNLMDKTYLTSNTDQNLLDKIQKQENPSWLSSKPSDTIGKSVDHVVKPNMAAFVFKAADFVGTQKTEAIISSRPGSLAIGTAHNARSHSKRVHFGQASIHSFEQASMQAYEINFL